MPWKDYSKTLASNRRYYKANKEKFRAWRQDAHLKKKYGISAESLRILLELQCYKCAVCGDGLQGGRLTHIDHDHGSGEVRGVLCRWCNLALGHLKDNTKILKRAIAYLEKR